MKYTQLIQLTKTERAAQAASHHRAMMKHYNAEILRSVRDTTVITDSTQLVHRDSVWATHLDLWLMPSVDALFKAPGRSICVHNFASFKRPGGGFMSGSFAQEESLCHSSTLYEVLSQFKDSFYEDNTHYWNRGMYTNRMLFTPGIVFESDSGAKCTAAVLTSAAPNIGAGRVTASRNTECLRNRIDALFTVAEQMKVDTLITGAWGCGVFKQDPREVARYMVARARRFTGSNVIFAVTMSRNPENIRAFQEALAVCKSA